MERAFKSTLLLGAVDFAISCRKEVQGIAEQAVLLPEGKALRYNGGVLVEDEYGLRRMRNEMVQSMYA